MCIECKWAESEEKKNKFERSIECKNETLDF